MTYGMSMIAARVDNLRKTPQATPNTGTAEKALGTITVLQGVEPTTSKFNAGRVNETIGLV